MQNQEPSLPCSLNTLGTYIFLCLSCTYALSLSIKGHEMRNFSKVSLQKRGLASSPVYRCGRQPWKRASLSAAQGSGTPQEEARLTGTHFLQPHRYYLFLLRDNKCPRRWKKLHGAVLNFSRLELQAKMRTCWEERWKKKKKRKKQNRTCGIPGFGIYFSHTISSYKN